MTLSPLITKNIERVLWLAALIVLFLLFKKCDNKKADRIAALEKKGAERDKKHQSDSIEFARKEQRWQDSIARADINSDLQVKVIKETEKKLAASQNDVNRLTAIVRTKPRPVDSSFVLVPPEYKEACDSLPGKIDQQNIVIADLQKNNESLVELTNYETSYRDSLIEDQNKHIDSLKKDYREQKADLKASLKLAEPRGRLLGGISILGNQNQFLSGAGVVLAYQSKGGKQYQVSPKFIKVPGAEAEVYYEGTVLFTIFK